MRLEMGLEFGFCGKSVSFFLIVFNDVFLWSCLDLGLLVFLLWFS